jgi:hypothetical protein
VSEWKIDNRQSEKLTSNRYIKPISLYLYGYAAFNSLNNLLFQDQQEIPRHIQAAA